MESYVDKALDEVVKEITESKEYKKCIELKMKMKDNEEINSLVEEIKKLQKEFIRTNNLNIKEKLSELEKELESIPIYVTYMKNLEVVNENVAQ